MLFVLHFIAAIQILFTLVANYVQTNPLILCEPNNFDHGYAITAACKRGVGELKRDTFGICIKKGSRPFPGGN